MKKHSLMEIFEELSFREFIQKILYGIKQPRDSGDYKYSLFQIQRLWALFSAILVPLLFVIILSISSITEVEKTYNVTVIEPKEIEKLDDIKEIIEPLEPTITEPIDIPMEIKSVGLGQEQNGPPTPVIGEFSPQPSEFDSVSITRSPIIISGVYQGRSPGQRGDALASNGGNGNTETAVYRALRWLKKYQETDGKWTASSGNGPSGSVGTSSPAMTGLALLTYLAHGETPSSPEFGYTVEMAMKWLVENQKANGHFEESDPHEYSLPIAAYALCESYSLTRVPMLKEAAEKSIKAIVDGQSDKGLWTYQCIPSDRNDTSYGGWCIQAIKAAIIADLNVNGLKETSRKAILGIKSNYGDEGFGYTSPGKSSTLTPVGVLSLQLLGAFNDIAAKKPIDGILNDATCNWEKPHCSNPIYAWYYLTQVKFHTGGQVWINWNKEFSPTVVKNQIIIPKSITDTKGKLVDIGYWESTDGEENCKSYVYNTTLLTLMLEVYYRHLPTFKAPKELEQDIGFIDQQDIKIRMK